MERKPKILVVDDEESIRLTFEVFLTEASYEVKTASNYQEALAVIQDNDFDLIFLDIILRRRTGIDLLREIKKRGLNCPVIIITGDPSAQTATEAFDLGAFGHISKPVTQEKLLRLTRIALKV
ncbi:MAG: response regulator [Candidatus Sulfobium sp.]|jgi:two-component system, NtrC family, response regulator HydG